MIEIPKIASEAPLGDLDLPFIPSDFDIRI
jgi:hypothetical protein